MKNRLGFTMILGVLGVSCALAACGDDDDGIGSPNDGGAGGEPGSTAGTKTGGSSSGGVAGKGGNPSGGKAGATNGGSSGSAALGGAGGEGGTAEAGAAGATNGGAGGSEAGAAGSAGAGGAAPLEYSCGVATISQKLCSAFLGIDCAGETQTCLDCVPQRTADRTAFVSCPACLAEYDKFYQCGIDAYESGDIASGLECVQDYGADLSFDNCVPFLDSASDCHAEEVASGCPATWP